MEKPKIDNLVPKKSALDELSLTGMMKKRVSHLNILLFLKVRMSDITEELFSQKNPLGVAFLICIISIAGMLLIFEAFCRDSIGNSQSHFRLYRKYPPE
jgi:hypothetical protein